jgi:hypothetical protein
MTGSRQPARLIAAGTPRRTDSSPAADWAMALILLARAEGHGACGGLRPGLAPGRLACPCGGLTFDVISPVPATAAEMAAVVVPGATR